MTLQALYLVIVFALIITILYLRQKLPLTLTTDGNSFEVRL